jgi:hypothetical protein
MKNEKGIITGHFILHWGVPNEIRPMKARGIEEFAILEFAPRGTRKTWRYATNGMSSYYQFHPDQSVRVRTEIYACTSEKAIWVDELLAAIASYPKDYNTYIAQGDTIDVESPIDRNYSFYTGILIAPPGPADTPTVGLIGGLSNNVLVQQVVGLFPNEVQFAKSHGGNLLFQQLSKNKEELLLDYKRVACC